MDPRGHCCGLTLHSSRRRFVARPNSAVMAKDSAKTYPHPHGSGRAKGAVRVTSCPSPRRGAVSRRTPSRSKSTSVGSNPSRALATTNTRRRRWARPKYWASRTRHAIVLLGPYTQPASCHFFPGGCSSQSSPASAPRKHPKAFPLSLRTPGTFSRTMTLAGFRWPART